MPEDLEVKDPFTPIEVTTLAAGKSPVPAIAIHLRKPDGSLVYVDHHSDQYHVVSNTLALETAEAVMHSTDLAFSPLRSVWDGKRWSALYVSNNKIATIRDVDRVGLGLLVQNSYNATLMFGVRLLAIRFACENGLVVGSHLEGFTFKHVNGSGREGIIEDGRQRLIEHADAFVHVIEAFRAMDSLPVSACDVGIWARELVEGSPAWPKTQLYPVLQQLEKVKSPTVWDLYNAFTYVTSHELNPFTGVDLAERVADIAFRTVEVAQ